MAKRSAKGRASRADAVPKVSPISATTLRFSSWPSPHWIWGLILFSAVVLFYLPVWWAGYIWDDDTMITGNPVIIGPLGLKEIWTTSAADICPLTLTTFWIEHALWGLAPLPDHLVTVFLHGGCAVMLWQVLRGLRVPGAWLGAALWALHPVQVESVAWIAETKNTQSGLFFLLSILFFLRWLEKRRPDNQTRMDWNYALVLLFALLAMTSKASTVVLPVVLGLCAWWMEGRWRWRNALELIPVFVMSICASALSAWTQKTHLATFADPQLARTWPERIAIAGDAVWFYLGKLVWPHPLVTIYPRWKIDTTQLISYIPTAGVLVLIYLLWIRRDSWSRPFLFSFSYFLIALLPVLGFIDNTIFSYSFVFDHFQYLASMGPLALAGAGLGRLADLAPGKAWLASTLSAGLLLVPGLLTCQRAMAYRDAETIWTDTLSKNPNCWLGYNDLGIVFLQKGRRHEALALYQRALEIKPDYVPARNNVGAIFLEEGELDKASAEFQTSLRLKPNDFLICYNLGLALSLQGKTDEGIRQYRKALEINPLSAETHEKLGAALSREGQLDDAIVQYQRSLEIDSNSVDAHNDFGNALLEKGELDEATAQFQKALEINPNAAGVELNLGHAFSREGKLNEAIAEYKKALEINPAYADAYNSLGSALAKLGRINEAIPEFEKALQLRPDNIDAQKNLAKARARLDQSPEKR